jgi:hypothetical protein
MESINDCSVRARARSCLRAFVRMLSHARAHACMSACASVRQVGYVHVWRGGGGGVRIPATGGPAPGQRTRRMEPLEPAQIRRGRDRGLERSLDTKSSISPSPSAFPFPPPLPLFGTPRSCTIAFLPFLVLSTFLPCSLLPFYLSAWLPPSLPPFHPLSLCCPVPPCLPSAVNPFNTAQVRVCHSRHERAGEGGSRPIQWRRSARRPASTRRACARRPRQLSRRRPSPTRRR